MLIKMITTKIFLLLSLTSAISVAAQTPFVIVKEKNFSESFDPKMNISSERNIIGLQTGDLSIRPARMEIRVQGIQESDKFICFNFMHISGGYYADAVVKNTVDGPTAVFKMPSKKYEKLKPKALELATRAYVSSNKKCDQAGDHLSVSWIGSGSNAGDLHALVNMTSSGVARIVDYESGAEGVCESLTLLDDDKTRSAQRYSHICTIEKEKLDADKASIKLIVETSRARYKDGEAIIRLSSEQND